MIRQFRKAIAVLLAALMLLLCACAHGDSDEVPSSRNKDTFTPTGEQVESSIFGRNIKYDGFTPAENVSLPLESSDILDMLQIEKVLYFLTDGAIYVLDIESGVSGKLFDTEATMFASFDGTIYAYASESGKICAYSAGGEVILEDVLVLQNEKLVVEEMFVTDDYYAFKCLDKSGAMYVTQYNIFDRKTLEQVNSVSEKAASSEPFRAYCYYKGNSLLKAEESYMLSVNVYEIDLETGKSTRLTEANINTIYLISDFVYNPKTDTIVFFVAPKPGSELVPMYISEYSLNDPDNIVQQRFYVDTSASNNVFVSVYENIVSAISSADNEYRYFDYLNVPESITLACQRAEMYEDIIYGFEAETGILVRTVNYADDITRIDIKLMAGDTDFDLYAPIYLHQHKYFLADMFEDLSKYEGLKRRLDGDLAAGHVSNLDGKYVGIPIYIASDFNKEIYPEDGSPWTYSILISKQMYLAYNIDVADGIYKDGDGTELYKLLKFIYDNPNGNEAKMPFGKEIAVLSNEFVLMNPSSTHKENSAKFLEYMFDALNGDIDGIVPEDEQYININSTDDVYVYWRYFAADYINPIFDAIDRIAQCDGKNSTIKEIAREAAAQVRMRLME